MNTKYSDRSARFEMPAIKIHNFTGENVITGSGQVQGVNVTGKKPETGYNFQEVSLTNFTF